MRVTCRVSGRPFLCRVFLSPSSALVAALARAPSTPPTHRREDHRCRHGAANAPLSSMSTSDDGGLGVVRVKPLGAGGGGGERSAASSTAANNAVRFSTEAAEVTVDNRHFDYPSHVISPDMEQQALYDAFMPARIQAFLDGVNVNVIAYGQTGSGKTHTMFGPPGIMARAALGELGDGVCTDYGLFPRGLLAAMDAVATLRQAGIAAVLTASAVELSIMGNEDMLARSESAVRRAANGSSSNWSRLG